MYNQPSFPTKYLKNESTNRAKAKARACKRERTSQITLIDPPSEPNQQPAHSRPPPSSNLPPHQ
jgi:hypothetical protein